MLQQLQSMCCYWLPTFLLTLPGVAIYPQEKVIVKGTLAIDENVTIGGSLGSSDTVFYYDRTKGAIYGGRITPGWIADSLGHFSFGFGNDARASGHGTFSAGAGTEARGLGSIALGWDATAVGDYSKATGRQTLANGWYSTATGLDTEANGYASFVLGMYNDPIVLPQTGFNSQTPLLIVGNGTSDSNRKNAFVINQDGKTNINGSLEIDGIAPSLRINGGTEIRDFQSGTATIGDNPDGGVKILTVNFPNEFYGQPRVVCTVRGANHIDTFVASTRVVSNTHFIVNVYRVDNDGGNWGQSLELDWIALR